MNARFRARGLACTLALAASLAFVSNALADPDVPRDPDDDEDGVPHVQPKVPRGPWYGWQTLIVDGVGIAIGAAALAVNNPNSDGSTTYRIAGVSALSLAFGTPIVHIIHGKVGAAFISLGTRIGLGVALGGLGYLAGLPGAQASACPSAGACPAAGGANLGLVGGIMLAGFISAIIDARAFAYEDRKPAPTSFTLSPRIGVLPRGGAFAGVGGTL